MVTRLRSEGLRVEAHDDNFAPDTTDEEWLTQAGQRGWIVLTKDKAIRRNHLEREALVAAGVACFMLGRGDLSADQMARAFIAALPRMQRVLRRYDAPLAASVTASGHVALLMAEDQLFDPPKPIK